MGLLLRGEGEKGHLYLWILGHRCCLPGPCESSVVAGDWKTSSCAEDRLCGAGATQRDSARPRFPCHGSAGKSLPAATAEGRQCRGLCSASGTRGPWVQLRKNPASLSHLVCVISKQSYHSPGGPMAAASRGGCWWGCFPGGSRQEPRL